MTTQTNSLGREVIAHHEAGHAVVGIVLGVEFKAVRIAPGEDGMIGFHSNKSLDRAAPSF